MAAARDTERHALVVVDMTVEQTASMHHAALSRITKTISMLAASPKFAGAAFDCRLWIRPRTTASGSTLAGAAEAAKAEASAAHDADSLPSTLSSVYPDVGVAGTDGAALIPALEDAGLRFTPKANYSAFYDSSLDEHLRACGATTVAITGINTDYCIFATALDAFYRGYRVAIVEDGVYSVAGARGHKEGLSRAQMHFGDACVVAAADLLR